MRILFTKSDRIGSNLIRWGLEEPVSHVAMEVENLVLHSTWDGVDIDHIHTFLETREIVCSVEIPELGWEKMLEIARKYEGRSYDFVGLLLFAGAALSRKFFGTPLPKYNTWNQKEAFLCTEIATMALFGRENGIITPYELYLRLENIYGEQRH